MTMRGFPRADGRKGVQDQVTELGRDLAAFHDNWLLLMCALMFIGGASGSTAGGIKVTTIAVLSFMVLAEIRGDASVHVHNRRIPLAAQRQRHIEAAPDIQSEEILRGNADDVEPDAFKADRLLQHRRRTAEFALPVGVTQHRAR